MFRLFPMCSSKVDNKCPGVLIPIKVSGFENNWDIKWKCTYCSHSIGDGS